NPKNRCYLCKSELFKKIVGIARDNGIEQVVEGSNVDDEGDYRPGLIAIKEQGILSPLRHAGLTKAEIRELSKKMDLPTWSKQSFACLASRFPYGEEINETKLSMVDKAEQLLLDLGLSQVRVRIHGTLARIEVDSSGFDVVLREKKRIADSFKSYGFDYVSLDLQGYRMGSMNETLK
ncbi:MAG: ATP-dependent sacrificial sulfur transferase LarE, partial [Ruminococcus sp.]|nr:ATP-dependent sacrificial sulfur transferase LarE [Ruminococcus sp.]